MGYWVGVEFLDGGNVVLGDDCNWVGAIETGDGCSKVVGIGGELCGSVPVVVWWWIVSAPAVDGEGIFE